MKNDVYSLPMRSTTAGLQIETRPLHVEEWLDSLPYVDFKKASQLLLEAIKATNSQVLKPAIRLELVELYNRPYQYYIDSQIKAGAQHTLQSIETMQDQTQVLKRIAVNLGLACKISAEEILKSKSLWGQSKPPLLNMLHSLKYLSHALIFSFLEYSPTPNNVWREINLIYDFAESLGQENTVLFTGKNYTDNHPGTIAQAYTRICLAALADPHHLPYGAIWEIFEQLNSWVALVKISSYKQPAELNCHFVLNLDSDTPPLPLGKFNNAENGGKYRLIDGTALVSRIQTNLATLERGGSLDKSVLLSPYFAKIILGHMARVWGIHPKRANQRKERAGTLQLACGINAAYYLLNDEKEFNETSAITSDTDDMALQADSEITPRENYRVDKWSLVDQSSSGFAVIKNDRPTYNIRVGDLIIINIKSQAGKWAIGVIRWMMIRQGQIYKIGVQILSAITSPVAIRACKGSMLDTSFRRGLLVHDPVNNKNISIISSKGLYINNRDLEIATSGDIYKATASTLLESTTGFEHFVLNMAGK